MNVTLAKFFIISAQFSWKLQLNITAVEFGVFHPLPLHTAAVKFA